MAEPLPQFYRRVLPAPAVDFVSDEGRAIFREAMAGEFMNTYFGLAAQFRTQNEPAFCGLASLVMALNALSVDPRRQWKGVWRWFSEEMLACCAPLDRVRKEGVTIDTLACLARCNGAHAHVTRVAAGDEAGSKDEAAFRAVVRSCTSVTDRVLLASYDRRGLGQTGSGHFSPIGGYCAERDMVLVLDVARFKLPPHWVPLSVLVRAMRPLDTATGLPRGWMVVSRMASAPLLLFEAKIGGSVAGRLTRLHRCTLAAEAADARIQRAFSKAPSCSKECDGSQDSKEDAGVGDGASELLQEVAQRTVAGQAVGFLSQRGAPLPPEPRDQAAVAAAAFVRVYAGLLEPEAPEASAAATLGLSSRIDRLGPEHVEEARTFIDALEATDTYSLVSEAIGSLPGSERAGAPAPGVLEGVGPRCTLETALLASDGPATAGGTVERAVTVSVTHTISMLVLVVATQAAAASGKADGAEEANGSQAGALSAWSCLMRVASDDLRSGGAGEGSQLLLDEVVLLARQYQQLACASCGGGGCAGC